MPDHVHDLEAQLVCETCGHREGLPAGSVVLTAEQVGSLVAVATAEILANPAIRVHDYCKGHSARAIMCLLDPFSTAAPSRPDRPTVALSAEPKTGVVTSPE